MSHVIIFPRDTGLLCVWCSGLCVIPQPPWKWASNYFIICKGARKWSHVKLAVTVIFSFAACDFLYAAALVLILQSVARRHFTTLTWTQWNTVNQELACGLSVSQSAIWSLDCSAKFSHGVHLFPSLLVYAEKSWPKSLCLIPYREHFDNPEFIHVKDHMEGVSF